MGRRRSEKTDTQWLENWSEEELLFKGKLPGLLHSIKWIVDSTNIAGN